jgi:hypothetical protein
MYADEMYDEEQRRWIDEDEMGCDDYGDTSTGTSAPGYTGGTPKMDTREADDHMAAKYIKSSSQADVMRGQGVNWLFVPHPFEAPNTGFPIIGGSCVKCGEPATSHIHDMGTDMKKRQKLTPVEVAALPLVSKLNHQDGTVTLEFVNIPNEQARRIVESILPRVMELYLNKSKDYDGNVMALLKLGPKASFVDLWRKIGKLKGALWDEKPMVGEQADEILADCVGHILITLDEMNNVNS